MNKIKKYDIEIKYLNDNESYHGDICPEFIYIDKKNYQ